jgi:hypothetical protein
MPGHEDHRHLRVPLQRRAHQRHAVGAGHADIGDEDAGKLGRGQMRQGLGRADAQRMHVDLLQRQRLRRGLAQVRLVIDEKNGARSVRLGPLIPPPARLWQRVGRRSGATRAGSR